MIKRLAALAAAAVMVGLSVTGSSSAVSAAGTSWEGHSVQAGTSWEMPGTSWE